MLSFQVQKHGCCKEFLRNLNLNFPGGAYHVLRLLSSTAMTIENSTENPVMMVFVGHLQLQD